MTSAALTQPTLGSGPPEGSTLLSAGFVLIAVAVALWVTWLVARAGRGLDEDLQQTRKWTAATAAGIASWMTMTWLVAATGILGRFDLRPPPFVALFLSVLTVSATLAFSRFGTRLVRGLPLWMLVLSQSFRAPLEWFLHRAAEEGVSPVQMSYAGWNFDVVSGLSAIVVAWLLKSDRGGRRLAIAWNILGALLLANILTVAFVSTPIIAAFGPDRLNTWVAYPPYVWLPTVMVVWAITGHLIVARHLRAT